MQTNGYILENSLCVLNWSSCVYILQCDVYAAGTSHCLQTVVFLHYIATASSHTSISGSKCQHVTTKRTTSNL